MSTTAVTARVRFFPMVLCLFAGLYVSGCASDTAEFHKTPPARHEVPRPVKPADKPFDLIEKTDVLRQYPSPEYSAFETSGKPEMMFQRSHEKGIVDIKITPDSRLIVSASRDRTVKIWSAEGILLKNVPFYDDELRCLALSPDGRRIIVGADRAVYLLGIDGVVQKTFTGRENSIKGYYPAIVWSPDGTILSTDGHETLTLRDEGWNRKKDIKVTRGFIKNIAVSPDGKYFVVCGDSTRSKDGWGATARLWDMKGNLVRDLENDRPERADRRNRGPRFHSALWAEFSPDGRLIAVLGTNGTLLRLRTPEGTLAGEFNVKGTADRFTFAPDSSGIIILGSHDILKYDLRGKLLGRLQHRTEEELSQKNRVYGSMVCAALSNDGQVLAAGFRGSRYFDGTIRLFNRRGRLSRDLRPLAIEAARAFFSPDGSRVYLEIDRGKRTVVWNLRGMYLERIDEGIGFTRNGKEYRYYLDRGRRFHLKMDGLDTAFRDHLVIPLPDGTLLGSDSIIYDAAGNPLRKLHFPRGGAPLWETAADQDMRYFARETNTSHGGVHTVTFYTMEGERLRTVNVKDALGDGAIAAWGDLLATGHRNGEVRLWNAAGKRVGTFRGHILAVKSLAFSRDRAYLVSTSADRTTRIWNLKDGSSIMLVALTDGEWYAMDDEGRFICSNGARDQIVFTRGLTAYDARQLWDALYQPGLMTAFFRGTRMDPVNLTRMLNAAPGVHVRFGERSETDATVEVKVCARARDNGVGRIFVIHNGRSIDESSRGIKVEFRGNCRTFRLTLQPGLNHITGAAYDQGNTVFGTGPEGSIIYSPPSVVKPDMYILSVGVSNYRDGNIKLGYPADDARSVSDAFTRTGGTLYGTITAKVLTDREATREKVIAALNNIAAAAKKNDVVVLFLAGHGDIEKGMYYFLPHDADLTSLRSSSISVDELSTFTRRLAANKVLFLFDTCKSGAATASLRKIAAARGFDETRIIARIAREHGIAVFSASSVSQDAYEIKSLRHGIFTYCLLSALEGPAEAVSEDGIITAARLLARVNSTTRETAMRYLKIEQTPVVYIFGDDFGIGRVK